MNVPGWMALIVVLSAGIGGAARRWPATFGWLWYIEVQLIMAVFMIIGWFLLLPFCLAHAWFPSAWGSINDGRTIDQWKLPLIGFFYDNLEDGVSGQQALVWNKAGTVRSPYMPHAPVWWRAYCWSAWRNSCDNLKYVFAWEHGPQATIFGHKLGWWPENDLKVPLL